MPRPSEVEELTAEFDVYRLITRGSDDEEAYVVDELGLTLLPAVVILGGSSLTQEADVIFHCPLQHVGSNMRRIGSFKELLKARLPPPSLVPLLFDAHHSVGRLFISGDKSSVGKSSICLCILASLLRLGVDPGALAYIKPVTQCESEQLVSRFCMRMGIAHCGVGPVVFYKGFTRAYLQGETESSEDLLGKVVRACEEIAKGKKFVIIDGKRNTQPFVESRI